MKSPSADWQFHYAIFMEVTLEVVKAPCTFRVLCFLPNDGNVLEAHTEEEGWQVESLVFTQVSSSHGG